MIQIRPTFVERDGQQMVELSLDDFNALQEHVEDLEDSLLLAKSMLEDGDASGTSLEDLKLELGLTDEVLEDTGT